MLATIITRAFQTLFAACVLGISISAIRWQEKGTAPATTSYSAFAGAFGLLTALVGFAAVWITMIPGLIMAAVDAFASVLLLAGGIAFAIGLRGVKCNSVHEGSTSEAALPTWDNPLINGGCFDRQDGHCIQTAYEFKDIRAHCRAVEADAAFLFLGFLACVAAAVLAFIAHRRGGSMRHSAV